MSRKVFIFSLFSIFILIIASCMLGFDIDKLRELAGEGGEGNFQIITQPASVNYLLGDTIKTLNVETIGTGRGSVLYQWYEAVSFTNKEGNPIAGAEYKNYTPSISSAGIKYYYVVVTNLANNSSTVSEPVRLQIFEDPSVSTTATVNITDTNMQYVRGFGGMSNVFEFDNQDTKYMELRDIDAMFHPETGLGFNMLRIMLWHHPLEDVISGKVYPKLGNEIYCDIVKKVNQYGGYVFASPYTPPLHWKENNSIESRGQSNLKPEHYGDYVNYLRNWAKQLASNGAPIYALSIQNEPDYEWEWDGCVWSQAQHLAFFLQSGRFMENPSFVPGFGGGKERNAVLVISGEAVHEVKYNDSVKNDPIANANVDIYAYHLYGNMSNRYRDVQADIDGMRKEVWMTEKGINSNTEEFYHNDSTWNYVWLLADDIDHTIRINDSNTYIWWGLKRFYGMIGDNTYSTKNGEILPRGWVMSHWAKYATDTMRIPATVTDHPGIGNANDENTTGPASSVNVKASAFRRTTAPSTYWEKQVNTKEDSISLVIYDKRTDVQEINNIRINLPAGFSASKAQVIISDGTVFHLDHVIVKNDSGTIAYIPLPSNSIVSVKFVK